MVGVPAPWARVSGVYKRQVQFWLLGIAFVVVLLSGADTIRIWRSLQSSTTVRSLLSQQAAQLVAGQGTSGSGAQAPKLDTSNVVALTNALNEIDGVLGYDWPQRQADGSYQPGIAGWIFWKLVGVLLTVFAVSLGAPFWFDVLQKAANLCAAGPPPAKETR